MIFIISLETINRRRGATANIATSRTAMDMRVRGRMGGVGRVIMAVLPMRLSV
jgi:hypothetical protein